MHLPSGNAPPGARQHRRHLRAQARRASWQPPSAQVFEQLTSQRRRCRRCSTSITALIEAAYPRRRCTVERARRRTARLSPPWSRRSCPGAARGAASARPSASAHGSCAAARLPRPPGAGGRRGQGSLLGRAARRWRWTPGCAPSGRRPSRPPAARCSARSAVYRAASRPAEPRERRRSWRTPRSSPAIAIERSLGEEALRTQRGEVPRPVREHRRRGLPEQRATGACCR